MTGSSIFVVKAFIVLCAQYKHSFPQICITLVKNNGNARLIE